MAFRTFYQRSTTKLSQNHFHLSLLLDKQLIKAIIKLGTLLYLTNSLQQTSKKKIAKDHTKNSNNVRLK